MTSRCTTFFRSLIKTALVVLGPIALAPIPAAPALAVSGPSQVLYIFAGAFDDGGANFSGSATAVNCFSFSPVQETLQYVVRKSDGTVAANVTTTINSFETLTAVTHFEAFYSIDVNLGTGGVKGAIGIAATSSNIVCTAQVLNASATVPTGIELHGTRFKGGYW